MAVDNNEREPVVQFGADFIKEQTDDANEFMTLIKNLEPAEKREVRGILIGLQMAKGIEVKTAQGGGGLRGEENSDCINRQDNTYVYRWQGVWRTDRKD